jgi:hypothetical protein
MEFSVVHQMPNVNVVQQHGGIGYEPAMTPPPQRFRAHDYSSRIGRACQQFVQGKRELVRLHVIGVRAESRMTQRNVAALGIAFAEPA